MCDFLHLQINTLIIIIIIDIDLTLFEFDFSTVEIIFYDLFLSK